MTGFHPDLNFKEGSCTELFTSQILKGSLFHYLSF